MVGNGGVESPSPRPRIHQTHPHDTPHFHSTVSQHTLRRFNYFIFIFRLSAFCFSLSALVFMLSSTKSDSSRWYDFSAFRFVVAANAIVALYSLFEMLASVWEISRGSTIFPEFCQVWFDFGHDQSKLTDVTRTQRKLIVVGDDYREVLSRYFQELPPFLGGCCSCPKCAIKLEAVREKIEDHHLNSTSSGSELCVGTSLDITREHVKVAAVGALLIWVCFPFILGVYYHQLLLPQLYNRSGS